MSGAPSYSFRPNFTASNSPCSLYVTDETKSRRAVGGTFFRSKINGKIANYIYIQGNVVSGNYVFTVIQRSPLSPYPVLSTETYGVIYANSPPPIQVQPPGPPLTPTPPPTPSPSIISLREVVNRSSKIIEMPSPETDYVFRGRLDSNIFDEIPTIALIGGNGPPIPPDPTFFSIRTGPERLMSYVVRRDVGYDLVPVGETLQWNGVAWIKYTPFVT